jgi:amidohydrolase
MADDVLPQTPHDELVRYRRHLHAHPELSLREVETAAFIERELRAAGIAEIRTGVAGTGVVATLSGGRPGPVTLLRADMDALPIQELNDVPYRSTRDGIMHACGHDGHVAVLLATARALAGLRDRLPGTVVCCFQPGEEGYFGARRMIEEGVLERPHVDRVFALHLYSGLEVGKIGIRDGAFFAASDRFELRIAGRGGHGGMPDRSTDPIVAAAHLITMLQTIVSREIAPKEPAVVTIGKMEGGTTFNVIPDDAVLYGTVRTLDERVRQTMPHRIERIVSGLCSAMRVEYTLDYQWGYPPTVNDRACNDVVRDVARRRLGDGNVVDPHDVVMWSEDMSYFHQERPGAYFLVGVRGEERGSFPQHSARYDIDERALDVAFRMMTGIALHG